MGLRSQTSGTVKAEFFIPVGICKKLIKIILSETIELMSINKRWLISATKFSTSSPISNQNGRYNHS